MCPRGLVVIGNVPIIVFDFEFRGNTIFAVHAGLSVLPIIPVFSIRPVRTILAIGSLCFDFIAAIVRQPVTVECPIIAPVSILLYSDNGSMSVLSVFTVNSGFPILSVSAVLSILTMINGDRITFTERYRIANLFPILHDGGHVRNIVVLL